MELNESTYALFDDFLSGNLSGDDKREFEKSLAENESLQLEFSFYTSAVTTIRMSGNQLLKKQIAEIGMGIPATAFQKYSPSIKPKNFFKKYWIAVAATSVAIISLTVWFVVHHQKHSDSENSVLPVKTDSAKDAQGTIILHDDSCLDSIPAGAPPKNSAMPQAENDSIIECNSFVMSIFPKIGHSPLGNKNQKIVGGATTYSWASGNKITVTFCKQSQKPPCYSLTEGINIFSSYSDSTNIRFYEMSNDELIMCDDKPGYFVLKRGDGQNEKLLIRKSGSAWAETDFKFGDDSLQGFNVKVKK